jgi:hypothetical protein
MCIDETPERSLNQLIDALHLDIGLGVLCSAQAQLGARCMKKCFLELRGEDGIAIRDKDLRHTVNFLDMIHRCFRHLTCCVGMA